MAKNQWITCLTRMKQLIMFKLRKPNLRKIQTRQNEQVERDNAKTELEKVGEAMGINPDDMTQEEKDILAHIFEKIFSSKTNARLFPDLACLREYRH